MKTISRVLSFLFLILGISLQAGPVRISFLSDEVTLRETSELLVSSGCDPEGVDGFKKAVDQFNTTPLKLDLGKFPSIRSGYYSFPSVSNLVAALPRIWCIIDHPYEINCFDTAILLTQEHLRANLHADEEAGPFVIEIALGTNDNARSIAAIPSDAFELVCPEWYRKITESFIPKSLTNQRPYLIAALQRFYILPLRTSEENAASTIRKTLDSSWKKMGLVFPKNCEVVLCHSHLTPVELGTVHAGVLFRIRDHYIRTSKKLEALDRSFDWISETEPI